jgi:hypothetical protein
LKENLPLFPVIRAWQADYDPWDPEEELVVVVDVRVVVTVEHV